MKIETFPFSLSSTAKTSLSIRPKACSEEPSRKNLTFHLLFWLIAGSFNKILIVPSISVWALTHKRPNSKKKKICKLTKTKEQINFLDLILWLQILLESNKKAINFQKTMIAKISGKWTLYSTTNSWPKLSGIKSQITWFTLKTITIWKSFCRRKMNLAHQKRQKYCFLTKIFRRLCS
jgi:hypothetical protein